MPFTSSRDLTFAVSPARDDETDAPLLVLDVTTPDAPEPAHAAATAPLTAASIYLSPSDARRLAKHLLAVAARIERAEHAPAHATV